MKRLMVFGCLAGALAFAACAFAVPKVTAPPSFAKDGELLLEPTYCCCSVEFGSA